MPVELTVKILPAATYAIFTLKGEQITSDWQQMIQAWMLRAGYESAPILWLPALRRPLQRR